MTDSLPNILRVFRPKGASFSTRRAGQVQVYRLLTLLGVVVFPIVGLMHELSSPGAFDPMAVRLAISGGLAGLLGISYVSETVCRHYVGVAWSGLYLTTGWVTTLTTLNQFSGEYALVFLFTYTLFAGIFALGSDSLSPFIGYLTTGFLFAGAGFLGAPSLQTSPLMLVGSMFVVAVFEGVAAWWVLSIREQMERQNDLFGRAQSIANVGAWEYDVARRAFWCTRQVYRICGRSVDEPLTFEEALSYFPPEDRETLEKASKRIITEGAPYDLELRLMTEAGEERWVRARGEPQWEGNRVIRVRGTLQDITEQKEQKDILRAAKEEAEEVSRAKSTFLANMSHEIRTPLTSIIGFAEAVADEADDLGVSKESPIGRHARLIEQSGRHLLDTLEGVLNLSELEAGQMEWEICPVDLAGQAGEVAEEFRPKAAEEEVAFEVETAEDTPQARADTGGVRIVLQNLVSNAIKYTESGGQVWMRTYEDDGQAVFEVEDTGIGMEPETMETVFEPFRQASEGLTREYDGSGVGLAVTKKVIEEMNGSLHIETEPGEGTRFTVRLPKFMGEPSANGTPDGARSVQPHP